MDKKPLLSYLRVQEAHERRLLILLRRSASNIDQELKRLATTQGVGAAVRRDQLRLSQAAIQREIARLWRLVGSEVEAGRAEAAAASANVMADYDAVLLRAVGTVDADLLRRAAVAQAQRGLDTVEARVLGLSRIPLSERVFRSQKLASGQVERVIENALARGASARDLAADVRAFIRPDVKGGLRYAAMRLGRTELNNAFHAVAVQHSVKAPWTTGMKWNLSGSHKVPDECNEYAEGQHYRGGEAGVFLPAEVPGKPHPQCLCFVTPENVDRATFVRQFESGAYDSYTDSLIRDGAVTF